MSLVNVINVAVLDNPTAFKNPLQFEITFECIQQLQEDLEWKVIYVGSAEDSSYDQLLEEVLVGPIPVGINKFVLQTSGPDPTKIKNEDLIGVTVILVICSYADQEFVRIGYYVSNEYSEPFDPLAPPNPVDIEKLFRNILANEPRVTRFAINWNGNASGTLPIEAADAEDQAAADADAANDNDNDDAMDEEDDDEEDEDEEEQDDDIEVDLEAEEEDDEDDGDGEIDEEGNDDFDDEAYAEGDAQDEYTNEDSMDVGMMQQPSTDTNTYSSFSNQGIF